MARPLPLNAKSLLANVRQRALSVALAHEFARVKPCDQARLGVLNRIYGTLAPVGQLACRAELRECREAKRGNRQAAIS